MTWKRFRRNTAWLAFCALGFDWTWAWYLREEARERAVIGAQLRKYSNIWWKAKWEGSDMMRWIRWNYLFALLWFIMAHAAHRDSVINFSLECVAFHLLLIPAGLWVRWIRDF